MLFIFGVRRKKLAGPIKREFTCNACGTDQHATFGILGYFHLFWIPIAPTTGRQGLECLHCKKVIVGDEIPERTRKEIDRLVFPTLRILPYFTGLILVGLAWLYSMVEPYLRG